MLRMTRLRVPVHHGNTACGATSAAIAKFARFVFSVVTVYSLVLGCCIDNYHVCYGFQQGDVTVTRMSSDSDFEIETNKQPQNHQNPWTAQTSLESEAASVSTRQPPMRVLSPGQQSDTPTRNAFRSSVALLESKEALLSAATDGLNSGVSEWPQSLQDYKASHYFQPCSEATARQYMLNMARVTQLYTLDNSDPATATARQDPRNSGVGIWDTFIIPAKLKVSGKDDDVVTTLASSFSGWLSRWRPAVDLHGVMYSTQVCEVHHTGQELPALAGFRPDDIDHRYDSEMEQIGNTSEVRIHIYVGETQRSVAARYPADAKLTGGHEQVIKRIRFPRPGVALDNSSSARLSIIKTKSGVCVGHLDEHVVKHQLLDEFIYSSQNLPARGRVMLVWNQARVDPLGNRRVTVGTATWMQQEVLIHDQHLRGLGNNSDLVRAAAIGTLFLPPDAPRKATPARKNGRKKAGRR